MTKRWPVRRRRGPARPRLLHWLVLPQLVVALYVFTACSPAAPTPKPHDTFRMTLPAPSTSADTPGGLSADADAEALADAIVHDVYVAEACHYDNPGCDPTAFQRIRDTTDKWKIDTGCTLQEIRVGASAEKTEDKLAKSGDARAALFRDTESGIEAARVIIATVPGVVLLVPPEGKPATYFGIVLVADCSEHPEPGLGDEPAQ